MYLNPNKEGAFVNIGYSMKLDFDDDGRAAIPLDIDGDGDLDLAVMSLQGLHLAENRSNMKNTFARIKLIATKSQHHALGANVEVHTKGTKQQDYVKLIAGFQSQVLPLLHFGTGKHTMIDKVVIRWPSGKTETHLDLPTNKLLTFTEGENYESTNLKSWPAQALPPEVPDYLVHRPVARLEETAVPTTPLVKKGTPTVVNFWAPWCKPCQKELPMLVEMASAYQGKIDFVGVSVETEKLDDVKAAIKLHAIKYDQALADHALLEAFFGRQGEAALPSTFVFNAEQKLVRAFRRSIEAKDLKAHLDSLVRKDKGVSYLLVLGESAMKRRDYAAAEKHFKEALALDPDNRFVLTQYGTILALSPEPAKGIKMLERVLKVDNQFHYAWDRLASARKEQNDLTGALKAIRQAIKISPDDVAYLVQEANLLIALQNDKAAIETLRKITNIKADEFMAWFNLARILHKTKKAGALSAAETAAKLRPKDPAIQELFMMLREQ